MCCNNVIDLCKFVQVWYRVKETKTSLGIVQHTVTHIVLVQMFSLQDDQRALATIRVCSHVQATGATPSVFPLDLVFLHFILCAVGFHECLVFFNEWAECN